MKCAIFTSLFLFLFQIAHSQDEVICHLADTAGRYREHNVDFIHLLIDVKFQPKEGIVFGKETLTFSAIQPEIDSLYLDAPNIEIHSVKLDNAGKNVSYKSTTDGVIIYFPEKKLKWHESHSLTLEYKAEPKKGLYFIGWNDEKNLSRKQIWTQGQGIDNRNWFPCFDDVADKVTSETIITFDKNYTVISNGKLIDTKLNSDSTKTWHYKMILPHAPYLVMIAIDKYAFKDYISTNGVISRQYYYADHPETEAPTYQYSKEMMDWLPMELGVKFPWGTYSNTPVQDFMFGAMENTTATIYGDFYLLDKRSSLERNYIGTNTHELTHQWFGDLITEWSATHHWLHESFATYYAKLFGKKVFGKDQYDINRRGEANQAIRADRENYYPVAHSKGGSARHYPKGSFVIDMLRYVVGDSIYHLSVKNYLTKHSFQNVDTHDFWLTFMNTSGINLDWFFEQWVLHSGFPTYNISVQKEETETIFQVKQIQKRDSLVGLFKMPIWLEVAYKDGSKSRKQVWVEKDDETFSVENKDKKEVLYTLFDPDYHVLHTKVFEKNLEEKIAIAKHAENILDRADALVSLRNIDLNKKEKDLREIYYKEKSYYTKNEIIVQIIESKEAETTLLLRDALQSDDFLVRRAAIENMNELNQELLPEIEKLLKDSSYITIEIALKKLVKWNPDKQDDYLKITDYVMGISKNVRIAWLEIKAKSNDQNYQNELIDYCSHSYEFRTRIKAAEAIDRLGITNETVYNHLMNAMVNPNSRLANPCAKVFKNLISDTEKKETARQTMNKMKLKDYQRKNLEQYF